MQRMGKSLPKLSHVYQILGGSGVGFCPGTCGLAPIWVSSWGFASTRLQFHPILTSRLAKKDKTRNANRRAVKIRWVPLRLAKWGVSLQHYDG